MKLQEIRRLNGLYLAQKHGGRQQLAEKLGYADVSQLGGLLSKHNPFGDKVTDRFESRLGLPEFWMSTPHPALWMELPEKMRGDADLNGYVDNIFSAFDKSGLEIAIQIALKKLTRDDK